jgi:1-hydroxycarotenoid 3,4-desaturase
MKRAIVLGAGMGGLAAAIRLAAAGHAVQVLEAGPRPGGKAGEQVVDGVAFDTGPSVVTLPDVFDRLLSAASTSLRDEVELLRPAPSTRYLFAGGEVLDTWPDLADTLAACEATLGPRAAQELASFLAYARRVWEAAAPHFVLGPAPEPRRLLRVIPVAACDLLRIDPLRTMAGALRARVTDLRIRDLLGRFATYNGSDLRTAPATLHCIAHVELTLGVYGVRGGVHALVRALVRVLERQGGELRCDSAVSRILVEGGRATGVELRSGERLAADLIVANADAAHVAADLLGADHPRAVRPVPTPSTSGWTGVLRARRRADRPAHAVLFPQRDYLEEFADMFDRDQPPAEPTVYLCAQEKAHARAGWPEHEPLFIMANAPAEPATKPRDPAVWPALKDRVLQRLRAANLIDPDDALVWERSPADLAATYPGTRGAIYGAASNSPLAAFRRPANRVRRLPGLYLASGSAHPGGGLPLCALSGMAAAEAALEDL